MNRFTRAASNYAYYAYVSRYTPDLLRKYQSERYHMLGRRGAYDTLVKRAGVNSMGNEEDMNMRYKTPAYIHNTYSRILWTMFLLPCVLMTIFQFDYMADIFTAAKFYVPGKPAEGGEFPKRYETMYIIDRLPRF